MIQRPVVQLAIGFDVDQISDQLAYKFRSTDGPEPRHPTGLFGGEVHFDKNSIFRLQVVASGKPERFIDFKVIDCTLITKPLIIQADSRDTRYALPSLFQKCTTACQQLALDFAPSVAESVGQDSNTRLVTKDWQHELNIGDLNGRWDISLILTVEIIRGTHSKPDVRVFSFDPEGQVGAGGGHD